MNCLSKELCIDSILHNYMFNLYVQSIGDFQNNENKKQNLDTENTYIVKNQDGEVTLEITGYFWGLRKYKSRPRTKKQKDIPFVPNKMINSAYQNIYKNLRTNSYLLLGDKKSGYKLFKIKSKFLNKSINLFDDNFDYCFGLEKTNYTINDKNLLKFIQPCLDKKGKKNFSRQSMTNFTINYKKNGKDLINYINDIPNDDN